MKRPAVHTSNPFPPIPIRSNDWCAHYDGEEEYGHYGWGETEDEAIIDFLDNCMPDHDDRLGIDRAQPVKIVKLADRVQP